MQSLNPTRTNLITNPSFESNTTGWAAYAGSTIAQSAVQAFVGTKSLSAAITAGANKGIQSSLISGLTSNVVYTVSFYLFVPAGVTVTCEVDTYTTGGAFVGAHGFPTAVGNGAWQRVTISFTMEATATQLQIFAYANATTTFYMDAVLLEVGGPQAGTYFDGNSGTGYEWAGTANNSLSYFYKFKWAQVQSVRKVSARVMASFLKTYSATTRFFTVGLSSVGGPDPIKGDGQTVVTEWDKYNYVDYSQYLKSYQITHELDMLGSIVQGMADIEFANQAEIFTPGKDATIGSYILPYRPFKLYGGFDGTVIPTFVGITTALPAIDGPNRTAKFHALDFIQSFYNVPLDQNIIYTNVTTDVAVKNLLMGQAGLAANQMVLDMGITTLPFVYFKKGMKLGDALTQLVSAELGRLFQGEDGMLYFWNRQHTIGASQFTFDKSNCFEMDMPDDQNIINVVEVNANVRSVQAKQQIWALSSAVLLPAGASTLVVADFRDDFGDLPVTTLDTPVALGSSTTSYWTTNTASDGSGTNSDGSVSLSASLVATGYLMTFTNSGSVPIYLTAAALYGTPAKVTNVIYYRTQDNTSVANYGQRVKTITNDFIQTSTFAQSIAMMLLADRKNASGIRRIITRALPALQLGDLVTYNDGITTQTYQVIKKILTYDPTKGFLNDLTLVQRTIVTYFTVGVSAVGGTDQVAP